MRKGLVFFVLCSFFYYFFANSTSASDNNQFVNIVNPVRISYYTKDLVENLGVQYNVISSLNLPATWLVTFDVLDDERAVRFLRHFSRDQELGLFLEVSPKFAEAAGISYNKSGSWHFANSVFLSGYTREERIKLLDALFQKFHTSFGYYPKSVGSWWSDAYSLSYINGKYGVVANLGVSDQYSTDNYMVWGQYWSTPFYPSKSHSGVPAPDEEAKLDLVTIQWAPRDPINGYYSSLFSTQDYKVLKEQLDTSYFEKLVSLYTSAGGNKLGQVTVGLESDLAPESYTGEFQKQMKVVKRLNSTDQFKVVTMSQFAQWYKDEFPGLSPQHLVSTKDLLGKKMNIDWYQSPNYRIGVLTDERSKTKTVIDLRFYSKGYEEPYYYSPNREFDLSTNIRSVIDSFQNPMEAWSIPYDSEVEFKPNNFSIKGSSVDVPDLIQNTQGLSTYRSSTDIRIFIDEFNYSNKRTVSGLSSEAKHFFARRRAILDLILGRGWNHFNYVDYYISDGEVDALVKLASLPLGKVMVYDNECLQCSWHTARKPAVFSNTRDYVGALGNKEVVYNSSVFEAQDRAYGREELQKLVVDYIYVAKYEDYIEKLPFSPGDLEIEKIYHNANAEIWKVKKSSKGQDDGYSIIILLLALPLLFLVKKDARRWYLINS